MKKGWEIKKLGEVCEVISGQSPEGKYYNNEGVGLPFYQGKKEFQEKYIGEPTTWTSVTTKIALKDDILMSVRAPVGSINYCTQKICIGRGLAAIRTINVNKDFIYYQLLSKQNEIVGKAGAVFPSINRDEIRSIILNIPSKIQEQEEIVERLDKGFELIDSLKETAKKNLDNAKELFQSVLREELSPKEGWETKTLGGVSNDISYGFTSKSSLYKGNAKYLRITDISQPIIDWDNVPYCEVSSEEFEKYKLIEGDLVIARTGATTGFNKIIKEDVNSVFASYLIRFRLDKSILFPNLIGYCLQSKEWYDYIKIISSGRAAQPGANSKQLSVFNLSFPKSIKEQEEIVNSLDRIKGYCEELEGNYKRVLELCEELKQGLLREAFSY
ncbi:MAG: restriction endonuclease subunit S [Bacteroidia bacterium]|nr:restriction endonuclease subunit S [Bacteroidia bacterium]